MYARSIKDPNGFWAEQAKRIDWIKPFTQGQEHLLRSAQRLDQMVRGRHAQRRLQLRRPPSRQARRPDRDHLGRRRSQERQEDHLQAAARRGLPLRQRAESARRQEGRPRHHLHADDSGGGDRHARLRAHRRHALGGVRRLLAGLARRPHRGLQVDCHRSPPTKACAAAARFRSRPIPTPPATRCGHVDIRHRGAPHRRSSEHEGRARRLLRRHGQDRIGRLPVRGDERGRPAVHPLHLGLDRQAEGRAAHHRRLSGLHRDHASIRVRLSRRRHLLVHRRRRLGHRPQLHRLWPALQRRHHPDVRGRAELSDHVALLGSVRQAQGQHHLHRADRDPRADAGAATRR